MILHHHFKFHVVSSEKLSILFSEFISKLHFQASFSGFISGFYFWVLFSNSKPMMAFRTLERVISQNVTKTPRSPVAFLKDYVNYLAW